MSRKVLKKSFLDEEDAEEEKEIERKDTFGVVPWSNPNELQATDRITTTTQGPDTSGTRRKVSSARYQDTSPGAEPLIMPGCHHPVLTEDTVALGIDHEEAHEDDGLTIEEGYDEQVTPATREEESTVNIIAQAVDTEEESQMHHEHDQLRQIQIRHERDQLRQMLDNAPILTPIIASRRDVENQNGNVHANHDDLASSDDPKCGSKGRRWFAISAILLIVVAITVSLALVLPSEPASPPYPLRELLSAHSSDGGLALANASTPQNKAFTWLAGDPNLTKYDAQELIQRYALATLYYITKGESWNKNNSWLSYEDVCGKWYNYDDDMTINCTAGGEVSSLNLSDNNLKGKIPPEIGLLSDSLDNLRLFKNKLDGTIPTEVGELTKLTYLSLGNNSLTRAIPSVIGFLTNLEELRLYRNELSGTLLTEMGNLTKLTTLALENNDLTGTIFPTGLGLLTELRELELDNNHLIGTIPPSIGTFTHLDLLDFGDNSLSGKISTELGLLTNLTYLVLGRNGFTGTIPSELGLLTMLTHLGLFSNKLNGTVPTTLNNLTLLTTLYLDDNDLSGSLLGFLCDNKFEIFAANTCGQKEIECECCTHCCDLQGNCERLQV